MIAEIKITYPAPLDVEKDKKITNAIESIGAKWWAQGCECIGENRKRDICFDLEI